MFYHLNTPTFLYISFWVIMWCPVIFEGKFVAVNFSKYNDIDKFYRLIPMLQNRSRVTFYISDNWNCDTKTSNELLNFKWRFRGTLSTICTLQGTTSKHKFLFLTWVMMVVESRGMRLLLWNFLFMTPTNRELFSTEHSWNHDLCWMGRKSKYVIEV